MKDKKWNIGVVGCGYWGENIVRNVAALGALRIICDKDGDRLDQLIEKYPDVLPTRSFIELLADKEIEGIMIATPATSHYDMAKEALNAGKDTFVEKPLAMRAEDAWELTKLAEEKGRILMVGHLLEYHPAITKIKYLIDNGELGKIYYLYSNRLNLGKIRTEENIIWSFAPHDISVMLYLLNEMPVDVSSYGGGYLHHNIADVTMITMSFPSGVKSHIFTSWLHPYKEHRLVIVGERKMVVFNDTKEDGKLTLYKHEIEWLNRVPTPKKADGEVLDVPFKEPLYEECLQFLKCISTRNKPRTDGYSGYRVLQVLDTCVRSLHENGRTYSISSVNKKGYYAHETAVVDRNCSIGDGTKIWHYSHVMAHASIGKKCVIGQNVFIANDVTIGNNVKIQNNVSVYEGVILEDDVFCGPSMVFTNISNPRSHISRKHEYKHTVVRKGATLGANSTILCGNVIGNYTLIGAGAVVTKDIPDYALVLGNPAEIAGWVCQCGARLRFNKETARCIDCNRYYRKNNEGVFLVVEPALPTSVSPQQL